MALLPTLAAVGWMAVLALWFLVLQARDVPYSELAVNTVGLPFLFLITLAAVRTNQRRRQTQKE